VGAESVPPPVVTVYVTTRPLIMFPCASRTTVQSGSVTFDPAAADCRLPDQSRSSTGALGVTVTAAVAVALPDVAVITAFPCAEAVSIPVLVTEMIWRSDDVHATTDVGTPFSVALACMVVPDTIVLDGTVTESVDEVGVVEVDCDVYLVQGQNWDCGLGSLGKNSSEQEIVNTNPAACAGVPIADSHASGQTTVAGTVTGTLAGTQASDDQVEAITEVLSSGGPTHKFSMLEHRFTFNVAPGSDRTLHVEGFRSNSVDADDFRFEYSIDGGTNFVALPLFLPLSADNVDLFASLPTSGSSVIIRVVDTNHTQGTQSLDTVSIDEIWVRVAP
jgi:hypothetical protein